MCVCVRFRRANDTATVNGPFSFVIREYYYNSDNDIALGETGVPASSRERLRTRTARLQTSRPALRNMCSAPADELRRLFLTESLIILLFERKVRKRQVRATVATLMPDRVFPATHRRNTLITNSSNVHNVLI